MLPEARFRSAPQRAARQVSEQSAKQTVPAALGTKRFKSLCRVLQFAGSVPAFLQVISQMLHLTH